MEPIVSIEHAGAPASALPVLNEELPPLNLPPRAEMQADGSVRLDLEFPKDISSALSARPWWHAPSTATA